MSTLPFDPAARAALFAEFRQGSTVFEPLLSYQFGSFNENIIEEALEVAAMLYSIKSASDRYCIVSLGAAPGEWSIRAERAYRMIRPNGKFDSYSLEGDLDHYEAMEPFMIENGANLKNNRVYYKVIAARDGYAYFPIINPDVDWGAGMAALADRPEDLEDNISMSEMSKEVRIVANNGKPLEFRTVEAVSLDTLIQETGLIDFLHCDIQGSEKDVFPHQMSVMNDKVRLACIGTHGRAIERGLQALFEANGWQAECAFPCNIVGEEIEGQEDRLLADGIYVWSNPRLQR